MKLAELGMEQAMFNGRSSLIKLVPVFLLALAMNSPALGGKDSDEDTNKPKLGSAPAIIWREPVDIKTRNLFYGQGGPDHQPKASSLFSRRNSKA